MTKKPRKPPISSEARKDWLKRHEEKGESPPKIAKATGYDVRTVRKVIALERQGKEHSEARLRVLGGALEKHYSDLCDYAKKLEEHLVGNGDLSILRSDPMWSALKEHLPRSPMWRNLDKWERLRIGIRALQAQFEMDVRSMAPTRLGLPFAPTPDGVGLNDPGILSALAAQFDYTTKGSPSPFKSIDFKVEAAEGDTSWVRYGPYTVGRVPNHRVELIPKFVVDLLAEVATGSQHVKMSDLLKQLGHVKKVIQDELLIIILRRVVPGKCRYCPL